MKFYKRGNTDGGRQSTEYLRIQTEAGSRAEKTQGASQQQPEYTSSQPEYRECTEKRRDRYP
jgi:hypothetical protein